MSRTQNERIIQLCDNSALYTIQKMKEKILSCIRFGWIYTDWYEILVIGISSDSIANKAIRIF